MSCRFEGGRSRRLRFAPPLFNFPALVSLSLFRVFLLSRSQLPSSILVSVRHTFRLPKSPCSSITVLRLAFYFPSSCFFFSLSSFIAISSRPFFGSVYRLSACIASLSLSPFPSAVPRRTAPHRVRTVSLRIGSHLTDADGFTPFPSGTHYSRVSRTDEVKPSDDDFLLDTWFRAFSTPAPVPIPFSPSPLAVRYARMLRKPMDSRVKERPTNRAAISLGRRIQRSSTTRTTTTATGDRLVDSVGYVTPRRKNSVASFCATASREILESIEKRARRIETCS